jgi:hypothetical protein
MSFFPSLYAQRLMASYESDVILVLHSIFLIFYGKILWYSCWNLVHVAHLVNSKACTIIVPYCQDKERLPCLNMGVSYHSKIDACERKGDC